MQTTSYSRLNSNLERKAFFRLLLVLTSLSANQRQLIILATVDRDTDSFYTLQMKIT